MFYSQTTINTIQKIKKRVICEKGIDYHATEFNRIQLSGNFCNRLPCEQCLCCGSVLSLFYILFPFVSNSLSNETKKWKFKFAYQILSKQSLQRMSLNTHETHKSFELWLYNDCHKINPSVPYSNLLFAIVLTFSYFRVCSIVQHWNVIITQWFRAAPFQANRDFFWYTYCIF